MCDCRVCVCESVWHCVCVCERERERGEGGQLIQLSQLISQLKLFPRTPRLRTATESTPILADRIGQKTPPLNQRHSTYELHILIYSNRIVLVTYYYIYLGQCWLQYHSSKHWFTTSFVPESRDARSAYIYIYIYIYIYAVVMDLCRSISGSEPVWPSGKAVGW